MSYESPIKMYIDKVTNNIIQEEEDYIISEIHKLGIVIDKEELMRALQYDRAQYELGFRDGSKNSIPIEWIRKWLEAQERISRIFPPYYHQIKVQKMLEDWEKENENIKESD